MGLSNFLHPYSAQHHVTTLGLVFCVIFYSAQIPPASTVHLSLRSRLDRLTALPAAGGPARGHYNVVPAKALIDVLLAKEGGTHKTPDSKWCARVTDGYDAVPGYGASP